MTNTTKHTQGPWKVSDDSVASLAFTPFTIETVNQDDGKYSRIATLTDCWDDEWQANAALIAAAPEMLEALIKTRLYLEDLGLGQEEKMLHKIVDEAIAKAEGKE
jgi:hypothetical protein